MHLIFKYPEMSQNCKNAKKMKSQIHCPVSGCLYSLGSERHFTEKRLLNQHIAKVHAEKKYSCAKCHKSFGLDWWRKHHEKTCGIEWKCDCGTKYPSRESLLTHARRNQHKLPDYVITTDKRKQKAPTKSLDNPIIVLIQPIIQNVTCIQPAQTSVVTPRPILPKTTQPVLLTLSLPTNVLASSTTQNISPVTHEQTNENLIFNSLQPFSPDGSVLSTPNQAFNHNNTKDNISTTAAEKVQVSVSTQTTVDVLDNAAKLCHSQASQCTRRKPKSLKVGIESTHTQTAESTVVKIKKRRSRRKSVAITTEPSMLSQQMSHSENSFWPGLKDFVLQHGDNMGTRLVRNSTSTQTTVNYNKVLCDSETITDQELLNFSWEDAIKDKENETCNTDFQLLTDIGADDTLSVLPAGIENNALPDLNLFSSNLNEFSEMKTSAKETESCQNNSIEKDAPSDKCPVFSVFGNCVKSDDDSKASPPTLSDIHTQTIASAVLDYNLLANMETQTTDDFSFSDLEFSDTETQTPWEDFPNIDDSPLQTDQLSIEIQTDFPSLPSGLNMDPFEFINSVDVQNMISGYSSKETLGVNSETQTLDKFCFPQFTNSEAQTLDMSDFMLDSLSP